MIMATELGSRQRPVLECPYTALASALIIVLIVATKTKFRKLIRMIKGNLPPGPTPLPIIGNLHMLGELPHQALAALALKYGPLMSLRLGSVLTLVVSSGDIAKEFIKTHDLLFANRAPTAVAKYLSYDFSDLVFAPYGPYWRQMRKLCVYQLLSSRRLDYFRSTREEEVSAMIRSVIISDVHGGSRPVSITKTVAALATSIICRMVFGRKFSDRDIIDGTDFISMIKETFLLIGSFNIGDFIPYLAWMDLQGLKKRLKKIHKLQDQFLENVIDEHIAAQIGVDGGVARDLVDVLLAASASADFQLTRDNIKAVLSDILAAGTDTSSTSLEWAMSEVLRNPPVMKKLQDELERVVGLDRMVCETDLPRLFYLQAVVKETLRLHPQGPFLFRHLSAEPCTVLGYEIPSGTRVLVNLWAIGRNPKSWENAESFRPERFMEAGFLDAKVQNFEWIPFGAGRRRCPGQQMATLVVELAVAQLLHCFNWKLPGDMKGQEQKLDMTERFSGFTLTMAHELMAVPFPRLTGL